jgi:uncharacterized membrane protein YjjP (DUF1212 family)
MTLFADIKTPIKHPVAVGHNRNVETVPTTTDVEANQKSNDCKPRPTLRRIASARTYPEGGRQAWLVVFGSFAGMMASFGFMATGMCCIYINFVLTFTVGIFQEYLTSHQLEKYGESTVGWIFSVYIFLSFFGGLQVGPVFDLNGPQMLLIAGSCCLVLGLVLMGQSTRKCKYGHLTATN